MSTFVEKLINNELPVQGIKPYVPARELLREDYDPKTTPTILKPNFRGFYGKNWTHGNELKSGEKSFGLEFFDNIKLGKFVFRPQFGLQSGNQVAYKFSLGLDMGAMGQYELTHQARNTKKADFFELSHYYSKNGMNTKASIIFNEPTYRPVFNLSSIYNQTMEILDRKSNRIEKRNSIYGIDTSISMFPFQQTNYALYYQSKSPKLDLIAAYLRKSVTDKFFSNNIVTGLKYRPDANKKVLAKLSYNVEDRIPQLDFMIRSKHGNDKAIKTFHKVSTNYKAGSGFTVNFGKFKLHGLAELDFMSGASGLNNPFNLSLRAEMNDINKPEVKTIKK